MGWLPVRLRPRLAGLLAMAGPGPVAGLAATRLAAELVPSATAVAAGNLVGTAAQETAGQPATSPAQAVLPVALLGGTLLIGRFAEALNPLFALVVSRQIDGVLRRRVRQLALSSTSIRPLEEADFRNKADRVGDLGDSMGRVRSPGTAAVGQVTVAARMAGSLAGCAVVAAFSPPLAAFLLATSLMLRTRLRRQWVGLVALRDADAAARRRMHYWSDLASDVAAAKEIRLFGLAHWVLRRRHRATVRTAARAWRRLFAILRRQIWPATLTGAFGAAALGVPGRAALHGQIDLGVLVTSVLAAWAVFRISDFGFEAFDIEYGAATVRAFDDLIAQYAHPRPGTAGAPVRACPRAPARRPSPVPPPRPPRVRFEAVSFRYPGASRPTLSELSLELVPGQATAIVGRNGAGKTTLIKLLSGLYHPTFGRITVDGADLRALDQRCWRDQLAVMFQDFVRYPGTLHTNIALSAPEALDDRAGVVAAATRAGAASLLAELPGGPDTPLWRGLTSGVDLSGGQWQRVAIARALFAAAHGRRIVVLDEPTAHLDAALEADFHRRVLAGLAGATLVLISHRLSTVRPADRIVLLAGGRVAEDGSHDELMALGAGYARLYHLQAARFTDRSRQAGRFAGPRWEVGR